MKVFGKCSKCVNEVSYSTMASTRVEFAMQEGETKILKCKECDTETNFAADELYTKESKIAQIVASLVFLIGTPLVFFGVNSIIDESRNHYVIYIVGGFLLVPVIVFGIIRKQDQERVNSFNRRKLKGRIHNV